MAGSSICRCRTRSILALLDIPAQTIAALIASAAIAGLARGFSGFGAALIFVPLASAFTTPSVAAPLLLVVDGVAALGLVPDAWRTANRREVGTMALGAIVGVPLGAALLSRMDPIALRWMIAGAILSILGLLMSGWRYGGRPAPALTGGVGVVAGLMSGIAQVGGPPVVAYWLGDAASKATAVRANIVLYFAISTVIAAAAYAASGLFTPKVLALAVVLVPIYGAGLFAGARMFGLAPETTFRRICYGLIAAAGIISLPALDGMVR